MQRYTKLYKKRNKKSPFSIFCCTFARMNETYLNTDLSQKRIAVLLSGGVDSSVVVYELARRGCTPTVST